MSRHHHHEHHDDDDVEIDVDIEIHEHIHVHHRVPATPSILSFEFKKGSHDMAALLGKVKLSPPGADVTKRLVMITLNDAAPFELDVTNPDTTFACNEGDTGSGTATDINVSGASNVSAVQKFTAALDVPPPPPPAVPDAPTILGFSFALASAPPVPIVPVVPVTPVDVVPSAPVDVVPSVPAVDPSAPVPPLVSRDSWDA